MSYCLNVETPIGPMYFRANDKAVTSLCFGSVPEDRSCALLEEAAKQLREYFAGERRHFGLPLSPEGTAFQRKVWRALCDIPCGETRSYGQIAAAVGSPGASRAVGMANNRNPIAIIIPCHRVIGADGSLTGYGGGLDKKEFLLRHERRTCEKCITE